MAEVAQLPADWQANPGMLAAALAEQGRQKAIGGDPRGGLDLFAKALALDPKNACALVCSGAAAAECKSWDDARKFTLAALDLPLPDVDAAVAWNNLGMSEFVRRDYGKALDHFDRSMALWPFYKQPVVSKGAVLVLLDRVTEAYALFERANLMNPLDWEPIVNRGILHLLRGDWDLGLPGYEQRKIQGDAAEVKWPVPRWTGEALNGRAIIVWPDQGLGDCIWAHRLVAEVARQGKVYLQIYELLEGIVPIPDGVTVVRSGDPIDALHFHVPVMSLPYCLRLRPDTAPAPYGLTVKHKPYEEGPPRVGLCWAGNIHHKLDDLRSIRLADMLRLWDALPPDTKLFTLQNEVRPYDRAALDWAGFDNEAPKTFKELADIIATLDLVISADTAVLHVAAEMGVSTWGLIPFAPDFRWGQHGDRVAWYPSLKLYRSRSPHGGGWGEVIDRIATDLNARF